MASLCFDPDGEKRTQVEKPVPETLTAQTAEEIGFYSRAVNGRGGQSGWRSPWSPSGHSWGRVPEKPLSP